MKSFKEFINESAIPSRTSFRVEKYKDEAAFKTQVTSVHSDATFTTEDGQLIARVGKRVVGVGYGTKQTGPHDDLYTGGFRK